MNQDIVKYGFLQQTNNKRGIALFNVLYALLFDKILVVPQIHFNVKHFSFFVRMYELLFAFNNQMK